MFHCWIIPYVYFSRLEDLIIEEPQRNGSLFDYWIDIAENHQPTGRYFAAEVKPYNKFNKAQQSDWIKDAIKDAYENVTIPILLVLFDNDNDHGYYNWIKEPETNGQLVLEGAGAGGEESNNDSLKTIVTKIKDWYLNKQIA